MGELNKDVSFEEIVICCGEVLIEEVGGAIDAFDLCQLVCKFLPELHPALKAWPVITRAIALSAKSAALFSSDSPEELLAKADELPGSAVVDLFAETPKEMLGTFDNEGFLVGHACILVWAKLSDRYYFLDPAQRRLDSGDGEIEFDSLAMIEVQKDQFTVRIAFDNGVSLLYWLYPEIAVPNLSAEAQSKVDRCVPKVMDVLFESNDDLPLTPAGPRLH